MLAVRRALGASLDLAGGLVYGNPVGANVQVPGYDLDRLTVGVDYIDNGTNLDFTELVIPSVVSDF